MNDESPASVDLSVAFFASVLVLFVFVTFAFNRETPQLELPSTGQVVETTASVPPSWSPIPERTTYAFLDGQQLQVLEMNHFSIAMTTPEKMVSSDAHFETITILSDRDAPEAFFINMGTIGGSLPQQWVRDTVPITPSEGGGCSLDEEALSAFQRRLLSVLVMRSETVDLPEFVAFADACNLRYRLIALPPASRSGRINITLALEPASFHFETIFR